jgi:hypothetical protein
MGGPNGAGSTGCAFYAVNHPSVSCNFPQSSILAQSPPQLRPDVSNGGTPVGVDPRTYTMPRYQNWSLSFQRQLATTGPASSMAVVQLAFTTT